MPSREAPRADIPAFVFLVPIFFAAWFVAAAIASWRLGAAAGTWAFALLLAAGGLPAAYRLARDLARGRFGVDVIAVLAMAAAALFGQWIVGGVILLMLSGGEALERYATVRARRTLTALLARAPAVAHVRARGRVRDVPAERVREGDRLVVKPGETVPTDGIVLSGRSTVDASLLTGEPLPADAGPHARVPGGSVNGAGLLAVRALTDAAGSQYARLVSRVREAETRKAPIVRLADRWSGWFTLITLALTLGAWLASGDPIRALAVLVVATPCPLILATPVAIIGGVNRAAGQGIVVKNGGALEVLARVRAFVFDKTGTLTFGTPRVRRALAYDGTREDEVLRLAAALDQGSTHVLARALEARARERGLSLPFPTHFREEIGRGVLGRMEGTDYAFGRLGFLADRGVAVPERVVREDEIRKAEGVRTVFLAAKKRLVGAVTFADEPRPGLAAFIRALRAQGIRRFALLTGDKAGVADALGRAIGIARVRAECLPEDKAKEIRALQRRGPVAMVGDGVNDAPALATADVGIAMGANGSAASAETADIVIAVDDVSRVSAALAIARRSVRVAKSGIAVGMGLSGVLMAFAAFGYVPPLAGAVLQEAVDVIVILNALRMAFGS